MERPLGSTGSSFDRYVKTRVREVSGHRFRPGCLIADFDISLLTAVQTELPT